MRAFERSAATDVRMEALGKRFGAVDVLHDIDLTVRRGELLALLGPSGSGKTTLLRTVAGLEVPDRGRVLFGGDDVTDWPIQRRGVGFVFQHYALFRHLSVADNIAFGPRSRPRRERPGEAALGRRIAELLELVQLPGLGDRFPAQLSGGQKQRVALARALAVEPRVLLLDEPFGAIDAKVRKDLRRWLREVQAATGQTTLFVTHDQDEAVELADRVAILAGGRLEQVGSADDIYDRPASAFVMAFMGEAVRLPVEVAGGIVRHLGRALPVPAQDMPDGPADLYLRPDEIAPAEAGSPLTGTVAALRRSPGTRRAAIHLDGADLLVEIAVPLDTTLEPGAAIGLTVAGGRLFRR